MAREPYNMTQEQIDNIAQRLHSYEADDYTLKWGKQTSKYRNSMRKSVRNMLSALEQDGFKLAGRSPAPAAGIEDPLKKAVAAFNALSPEQQAEMLEEQRQSWVRGNVGLSRDERGMTSPVMPQPTTAMASELKPWRYEIKYGPDGEDSYSWVYDDHGAMVATMKTHKAKQIVDAMNTRPAPAATDTGLVTELAYKFWSVHPNEIDEFLVTHPMPENYKGGGRAWFFEHHMRELLAAERAEHDNTIATLMNLITDNAAKDARIKELEADNKRLREALKFYADISKYPSPLTGGVGELWADCGAIARAALEDRP